MLRGYRRYSNKPRINGNLILISQKQDQVAIMLRVGTYGAYLDGIQRGEMGRLADRKWEKRSDS
jgi:hypothetical protein